MTRTSILLAVLFTFTTKVSPAQDPALNSVEIELQRLIQDPALKHGEVGFVAINLDNGKVIAEHNSYRAMVPASIQKTFTTGMALRQLGAGYKFKTRLTHTGEIVNGVLHGNLIIYGGGDPTFQSRFFTGIDRIQEIKASLEKAGIKSIEGKIVYDLSLYTRHTAPDAWLWEDMGNYFGARPTALMWKDNTIHLDLRSGQTGSDVLLASPWPANSPYVLEINIKAADNNKDDAWFFSAPYSKLIYGKGSIPAHRERFTVKISNPDPIHTFTQDLLQAMAWENPEIVVSFDPVAYEQESPIAVFESVPLSKLITVTNQESVNLFAEAILFAADSTASHKSMKTATAGLMEYLRKNKVQTSGLRLLDGSGVSPQNRITPISMIDFLAVMYRTEEYDIFKSSLAVGGQSGTLKYYFKNGAVNGNLTAKSGTMTGVRNYAGYITNKYDETVAFCLMLNDYDEEARAAIMQKVERLMNAVVQD